MIFISNVFHALCFSLKWIPTIFKIDVGDGGNWEELAHAGRVYLCCDFGRNDLRHAPIAKLFRLAAVAKLLW